MEWIKELTDRMLLWLLRVTSRFEKELTVDGRAEQVRWREQRLKNLEALRLRSQQFRNKTKAEV